MTARDTTNYSVTIANVRMGSAANVNHQNEVQFNLNIFQLCSFAKIFEKLPGAVVPTQTLKKFYIQMIQTRNERWPLHRNQWLVNPHRHIIITEVEIVPVANSRVKEVAA